jgi:shikimate dehydrogenase
LSPALHTAAYLAAGLEWSYTAIECDAEGLPALLDRIRSEPGWRGLSLTMPLKTAAVPLVDEVSDDVRAIGALNTIVVSDVLRGHNTDIGGVTGALREVGVEAPRQPVVLGAGGTARAALTALRRLGAESVTVVLRDVIRGVGLVEVGERVGLDVRLAPWTDVRGALSEVDVVISTTPSGATDGLASAGAGWPDGVPLVDVLYDPWPTVLASYAESRGSSVAGGLSVLVHQAAEQFELMCGVHAPVDDMRKAGEQALAGRRRSAI